MITFWPRAATCASTCAFAPLPIPSMAIIVPTPMMIPSAVKAVRSLFRNSARNAILIVAATDFMSLRENTRQLVLLRGSTKQSADRAKAGAGRSHCYNHFVTFLQPIQYFDGTAIADPSFDRYCFRLKAWRAVCGGA